MEITMDLHNNSSLLNTASLKNDWTKNNHNENIYVIILNLHDRLRKFNLITVMYDLL